MAITSNNLIGRTKQSAGNMTFTTWKGINVLKNKATSVANPKSDKQRAQRQLLSQTVALYRQIPEVIKSGFKSYAVKKSEFNAFTSYTLKNAIIEGGVEMELVKISRGSIADTPISRIVYDKANSFLIIYWDPATSVGQRSDDIAIVAVFNQRTNKFMEKLNFSTVQTRAMENQAFTSIYTAGDVLQVYLGFRAATTSEASDSVNAQFNIPTT